MRIYLQLSLQYLKHITGMNMPVIWLTSIASAFKNTKNTKTKYNYRY